jgi:aspartyl-tRNA(Asn)/glutamyl-tRNA(Gln) amidotransferase subunit C
MQLGEDDLLHLEKLSRITLPKAQEKSYKEKLGAIIDYVSKLSALKTQGVEPTSQVTKLVNRLREDEIAPSLPQIDVLKNSKHAHKGYFKLPKVVIE